MNKELLKLLETLKLDEEMKNKILEKQPKTRGDLIKLATQLGIEVDFDADPVELEDSELVKVTGGVVENLYLKDGY